MKRIFLFLNFFILLSLFINNCFAQNFGTIKGFVSTYEKEPMIKASVSLYRFIDSSLVKLEVTNADGSFVFKNVSDGKYFLNVSNIGYQSFSGDAFDYVSSENFTLDTVTMLATKNEMSAVVVTAKKPLIEFKADKMVVNVENSPISAGSSVFEVLEKSPGIFADKDGNLSMNGKNGLQVMIDGRISNLSRADLNSMLKNMQANDVQSIELITNPSAKYDASGTGGIINIKTKKSKNIGTNGSINAGIGYGERIKISNGINLNYRKEKLNIYGSYNYKHGESSRKLDIERSAFKDGLNTYFTQSSRENGNDNNNNFRLALDYNLNKKNSFGVLFSGFINNENQFAPNSTLLGLVKNITDSSLKAENRFNSNYKNLSSNINYKYLIDNKGGELSADANYTQYKSNGNAFYNTYYLDKDLIPYKSPYIAKNQTDVDINIASANADYTTILGKSLKFETGLKTTFINSNNDLAYQVMNGMQWQNDSTKSNIFKYDENVLAAYVNAGNQIKNTSLQFGLRAEYSFTKGNSVTENKIIKRSYLDFFPSFSINQKLSLKHTLALSFSRRIQRPNYASLNPFVYTIDEYTYNKGNPFLNPQYNNSVELTYIFKNKYILQAGYSLVTDFIIETILNDTSNNALYQTTKNLDQQKIYRITTNIPVKVTKWWNSNNNFNAINMGFVSAQLEGKSIDVAQTFVQINTNNSFTISKDLNAELSGNYNSSLVYGTLKLKPEYAVNAGISKSLWNNRGNLKFGVKDIFNTKTQRITSVYPGLNYSLVQKNETRVFNLTLTYKFGNRNIKAAKNKSTGQEDEQGRLRS